MQRNIIRTLALGCLAIAIAGCSGPSSQLAAIQKDKEDLLATIRRQRDAGRALKEQVASLETRLDQAEKELAHSGGTRISTRPAEKQPPVKSEPLPWRMPPAKGAAPSDERRTSAKSHAASKTSLAALAREDDRLSYDAQARAARFDTPIAFDENGANLTAEGRRQLDEVARFLKSDDARGLRIMVAGQAVGRPSTTGPVAEGEARFVSARQLGAARAQAVADYLDRHGVAQDRLGVTGVGATTTPGGKAEKMAASGGVQIYLLEPDSTVVGWGPTAPIVRR